MSVNAKLTYVGGLQFVGESETGHAIVVDGDHEEGGNDTGMRPSELLLIGLGGCTGMDVASILRKKKQPFTGIEVKVNGEKAEKHPKKYTAINIEYIIKGKGVTEEAVKRAVKLSMDRYCSVKATLEGSAKITWSYRIEEG